MSVVDGLRELEPQLSDDAEIIAHVLPLLLNVVEAAEHVRARFFFKPGGERVFEDFDHALAALESAQGAE